MAAPQPVQTDGREGEEGHVCVLTCKWAMAAPASAVAVVRTERGDVLRAGAPVTAAALAVRTMAPCHTQGLLRPRRASYQCRFSSRSESDVKPLWLQLRKDEPHLLSSFEDFLARIFSQLQEAHEERNELECALKK